MIVANATATKELAASLDEGRYKLFVHGKRKRLGVIEEENAANEGALLFDSSGNPLGLNVMVGLLDSLQKANEYQTCEG